MGLTTGAYRKRNKLIWELERGTSLKGKKSLKRLVYSYRPTLRFKHYILHIPCVAIYDSGPPLSAWKPPVNDLFKVKSIYTDIYSYHHSVNTRNF